MQYNVATLLQEPVGSRREFTLEDDEARVAGDRDAEVHVVLVDDGIAVDLGVDGGEGLERERRRLREEGHEAELHAVLLLGLLLDAFAERHDGAHVDLVERREMRGGMLRLEEILGDALAARRHLLAGLARAVGKIGRSHV